MFSQQQRRGVLYLLLIILVAVLVVDMYHRRANEQLPQSQQDIASTDSLYLFPFDPNTVTLKELRTLGLSKRLCVSLLRYRAAGKVFRIKEDLYECYNMTDSIYDAIEPYITIAKEYQYTKRDTTSYHRREPLALSKFLLDTVSVEYLRATGVLSRRQAEVFLDRHKSIVMRDMADVRDCYVVSSKAASKMEPYIIFPESKSSSTKLIDLNRADSAELRSVVGIGAKSVVEILKYRKLLGGFYSVNQLAELKVVTESNFERIITQISCDSCDISKIDVNFAVAKNLIEHPYISRTALRRLLRIREIKGGWSSIVELTQDNIFTREEAARLRPYLMFRPYTKLDENQ